MRTAIVLKGYPRLSETFVAQEILELERRGLSIDIVSLIGALVRVIDSEQGLSFCRIKEGQADGLVADPANENIVYAWKSDFAEYPQTGSAKESYVVCRVHLCLNCINLEFILYRIINALH